MTSKPSNSSRRMAHLAAALLLTAAATAGAETPTYSIEIRGHLFYPARLTVPRDKKIRLIVINRDATPEEFESYELNREKVVMGTHQTVLFIGPLAPGEYPFFGEFHPKTALGSVVAE